MKCGRRQLLQAIETALRARRFPRVIGLFQRTRPLPANSSAIGAAQRHYAERKPERAGTFPDWEGSRVVEPRPLGFRGSEQAQAARAALPYPVAQIGRRVVLQRVEDAHTGEVVGRAG